MNARINIRFVSTAAALAATAALLSAPAQAQQLTRAEVNQQTLAAMKAGEIVSGEGRPQGPEAFAASSKTRAERKAETLQARRKGELPVGGEGTYKSSISQQTATAHSTKTREQRKAETMEAIKNHETMQPGEAA
ncbi:MAG: DUF4148 domain-containing protein [Burkholderiaceae bacterium]|nr:DUF4148 domain-containing protein [Burkholderiaceae bacterium]